MKCQNLFFVCFCLFVCLFVWKNKKKKVSICCLLKILPRVLSVNMGLIDSIVNNVFQFHYNCNIQYDIEINNPAFNCFHRRLSLYI